MKGLGKRYCVEDRQKLEVIEPVKEQIIEMVESARTVPRESVIVAFTSALTLHGLKQPVVSHHALLGHSKCSEKAAVASDLRVVISLGLLVIALSCILHAWLHHDGLAVRGLAVSGFAHLSWVGVVVSDGWLASEAGALDRLNSDVVVVNMVRLVVAVMVALFGCMARRLAADAAEDADTAEEDGTEDGAKDDADDGCSLADGLTAALAIDSAAKLALPDGDVLSSDRVPGHARVGHRHR